MTQRKSSRGSSAQGIRTESRSDPLNVQITTDSKASEVEELLTLHRSFIQQNSHRLPQFLTADEAQSAVRKLQSQLTNLETQRGPKTDIDRRLSELTRQHETVSDEDQRIAQHRSVSNESKERETQEYSDILREITQSKSRLAILTNRLSVKMQANKEAQDVVNKIRNEVSNKRREAERLRNEERQLRDSEKELQRESSAIEQDMTVLIEGDEKNVSQLETIGESRGDTLRAVKANLSKKRSAVRSKVEVVQRLLREIESMEDGIDRAIGLGFVVEDQIDTEGDEESSGSLATEQNDMEEVKSEALKVRDLPLVDSMEVRVKVEAVTKRLSNSPKKV
jgi:chromosome segregation ATPase